MYLHGMALS